VSATDRISIVISLSGKNPRLEKVDRDDDDDDNEDGDDDKELEGAVSGLTGTCPSLTFTVQQTTVRTNSSTVFKDGPCTAITNGKRVEVEGTRQADGSIVATKVELD
jgi:hypothetical protein